MFYLTLLVVLIDLESPAQTDQGILFFYLFILPNVLSIEILQKNPKAWRCQFHHSAHSADGGANIFLTLAVEMESMREHVTESQFGREKYRENQALASAAWNVLGQKFGF